MNKTRRFRLLCLVMGLCAIVFCTNQIKAQTYYYLVDGGNEALACNINDTLTYNPMGAQYPAGVTLVITFCPGGIGTVVNANFATQIGNTFNIPDGDVLNVYDGDNTAAPLLGVYDSDSYPTGFVVQSTFGGLNPNGCMTFELISAPGSPGGALWGLVNCGLIWQQFEVELESDPMAVNDTVKVCYPTEIEFTANTIFFWSPGDPGYAQNNNNCTFIWNMGDGTTYSGVGMNTVTHDYGGAFGYYAIVSVIDSLGQFLRDSLTVMYSTTPTFPGVGASSDVVCLGDEVEFTGSIFNGDNIGFEMTESTFFTGGLYGAQAALPDNENCIGYTTTINIAGYPGTAVIDDPTDLVKVCLNMEHTFLGDLECFLTVPNGAEVILFNSYNSSTACVDQIPGGFAGGGTFLGNALDDGSLTPGGGLTYCFSPLAPLGTLGAEWAGGWTQPVVAPGTVGATTVSPGTFLPENPISDIYVTPVNGPWTINVYDMWGADNGYIFEWSIQFGPDINPDADLYTPNAVSATWSDGGMNTITSIEDSGIVAVPNAAGINSYIFTVTDDFGCAYDTTINVTVVNIPEIEALDDVLIDCDDNLQLGVNFVGIPPPPANCDWVLDLYDSFGDGWNGGQVEVFVNSVSVGVYTIAVGSFATYNIPVTQGGTIEIVYTAGAWTNENEYYLITAGGDTVFVEVSNPPFVGSAFVGPTDCNGPGPNYTFSWTPPDNLDDPTLQFPTAIGVTSLTTFYVTVWEANYSECYAIDSMQALPPPGALTAGDDLPGCEMVYQLDAFSIDNMGVWTSPPGSGITFSDPNDPDAIVTGTIPGIYTITWNDITGLNCPTSDAIQVTFLDSIQILLAIDSVSCYSYCDGQVVASGIGGTTLTDYDFQWSTGLQGIGENSINTFCQGNYWVSLTDDNGCEFIKSFVVPEPPELIIDSIITNRESCLNFCDGTVEVFSNSAGAYSFDGGLSFVPENFSNTFCGGNHTIYVQNGDGCIIEKEVFVASPIPPNAMFNAEPPEGTIYNPIIQFWNQSQLNVENEWLFGLNGLLGSSSEENPQFTFPTEIGYYDVTLIVTDSIGCKDSLHRIINIEDELLVFIPNAFTPNGDGINDILYVYGSDIDVNDFEFTVFDRWGRIIYESNNFPFAWNGSVNQGDYFAENGVYVWHMIAKSVSTTEQYEFTGHITLMR